MPYSIKYTKETNCIYISIEGTLDLSLFDRMATEVAHYVNEYGCRRILNDLCQATPIGSTFDIYSMPKHALEAGVSRNVRRALLVSGPFSKFRFLETVFINQGNIVKLFNDIDNAKRWLFGEDT
jgi:hypothetical protein